MASTRCAFLLICLPTIASRKERAINISRSFLSSALKSQPSPGGRCDARPLRSIWRRKARRRVEDSSRAFQHDSDLFLEHESARRPTLFF
ncbi:uncharacterized protein BDV14DRAFT_166157 [Aspergillus stella-maris]|uniref:uncharacterized protein n=1 Tax=Aspergillus stella-maris TaxID=1810926 RepID=UPI003CCE33DA